MLQRIFKLSAFAVACSTAVAGVSTAAEGMANLTYVSIRTGDAQIFTRDAQGAERMVTHGKGINTQPALASTGKLAFTSRVGPTTGIFTADEDGSGLARLTTATDTMETAPSWSPDGKKLAYFATRIDTGTTDLRIVDLASRETVRIAGGGRDKGPAAVQWSADGKRLCFLASDNPSERQVWVVQQDGSGLREITSKFAKKAGHASLSPDGQRIVWTADLREKSMHIAVTSIDTGETVDLTSDVHAGHEGPQWSPDGKRVVFVSTRDDPTGTRADIFVMDANGRNVRNLSRNLGENFDPKWSTDGRSIVFVSLRTGTSLLYEVDLASGITHALTQHKSHDMEHSTRTATAL